MPEQTRLYHFDEAVQAWKIGRLLDDHGLSQLIKFPNGQTLHLPVSDVFVRSGVAPVIHPVSSGEDRRDATLRRRSKRSLSGPSSASVAARWTCPLFCHQQ